jgi:hypothetical protein
LYLYNVLNNKFLKLLFKQFILLAQMDGHLFFLLISNQKN